MGEPLFRISVVAEMVGLSENLLRAWERRYKIIEPRRTGAGYRAYSTSDVELLRRVKQMVQQGVSISEVVPMLPALRRELKIGREFAAAVDGPRIEHWMNSILDAARRDQQPEIFSVLDEALATISPVAALELLIVPLQRAVGEMWHARQLSSAQEHLITHALRSRLLSLIQGGVMTPSRRHAVCACLPDEDHEIGLLGAALRFRDAGFRVTYLGARTPVDELAELVKKLEPEVVALAQVHSIDEKQLRHVLTVLHQAVNPKTKVVIGGAGAEAHAALVERTGAIVVTPEVWPRLLA